ncbi:serine/arginine repetitive matrix protein 1-like [Cyprinodon tularosa]|uniref:serine/arginine repetitive matrix protein 1-like n=1 Tax=Cyprinodon tularosa TaxID=77115 RepID=UPI0018E281A8|nr:serine/arginine repetitive matrix protein 1-like [Cyprinodon tularosa]
MSKNPQRRHQHPHPNTGPQTTPPTRSYNTNLNKKATQHSKAQIPSSIPSSDSPAHTPPPTHTQKKIPPHLRRMAKDKPASNTHRHTARTPPHRRSSPEKSTCLPAQEANKPAEREPHRQRTARTPGPERPRQKQHRKADTDEPTTPTKPPGGFPQPKTQRNHSIPPTTANTAARQNKGQSSPARRAPESQSSEANPAAHRKTEIYWTYSCYSLKL